MSTDMTVVESTAIEDHEEQAPDETRTHIDGYVTGLMQLYDQEQARAEELDRRAKAARDNAARIQKAIKVLRGEKLGDGGRPKKRSLTGTPGEMKRWNVSEDRLSDALKAFEQAGTSGLTQHSLQAALGSSKDTARKAILTLRQREKIRKAGLLPGTRNTPIYKLMPDGAGKTMTLRPHREPTD